MCQIGVPIMSHLGLLLAGQNDLTRAKILLADGPPRDQIDMQIWLRRTPGSDSHWTILTTPRG
jgi:hypothetical protein